MLFTGFVYVFLILLIVVALYPLILVVSASFSDEMMITQRGFRLLPQKPTLYTFRYMLRETDWIYRSYAITITVTALGTLLSMIVTCMIAYPLSIRTLKYRSIIAFFVFFTMIFYSGLVPWFLVVRRVYRLTDTIWAMILPALVNPWYMFLLRNYFGSIPQSLWEAAKIDGAGDFGIFTRVILPLSTPVLATISLFYALFFCNDWWHALMFIDKRTLFPLQYQLFNIISDVLFMARGESAMISADIKIPQETVKMAATLITIGPIVFLYPFIQRYFVKGIIIGAIKG